MSASSKERYLDAPEDGLRTAPRAQSRTSPRAIPLPRARGRKLEGAREDRAEPAQGTNGRTGCPRRSENAIGQKDVNNCLHEALIYRTALAPLQGKVVPVFHGLFEGQIRTTNAVCIILEWCGETFVGLKPDDIR